MRGFHHFYLGLFFAILSFFFIWTKVSDWFDYVLFGTGSWLMIDDFYQHMRQRKQPKYKSPLHRLYGFFYKISFIKKLNEVFDKLFGG